MLLSLNALFSLNKVNNAGRNGQYYPPSQGWRKPDSLPDANHLPQLGNYTAASPRRGIRRALGLGKEWLDWVRVLTAPLSSANPDCIDARENASGASIAL